MGVNVSARHGEMWPQYTEWVVVKEFIVTKCLWDILSGICGWDINLTVEKNNFQPKWSLWIFDILVAAGTNAVARFKPSLKSFGEIVSLTKQPSIIERPCLKC